MGGGQGLFKGEPSGCEQKVLLVATAEDVDPQVRPAQMSEYYHSGLHRQTQETEIPGHEASASVKGRGFSKLLATPGRGNSTLSRSPRLHTVVSCLSSAT